MNKVDIIVSVSLKSSIGPVQTLKRVIGSKADYADNGFDINLFTLDKLPQTAEETFKSKESWILTISRKIARLLSQHTKFYAKNRIKNLYNSSRRMLCYYDSLNRNPDIIVFHSWQDCYEYLTNYSKENVKVCLFIHSDGSPEGNKMILSYYPKLKGTDIETEMDKRLEYVMEKIDVMACITKIEETNLLRQYPFLKGKTQLVVNGITDLEKTQLEDSIKIRAKNTVPKYRFVSVGSMNGRKGHREIIECVNNMDSNLRKEVFVTFVGGGLQRSALEKQVERYGLQDYFDFVGLIPNHEVYKYQAKSNIGILFSQLEGLPLALLESLRSGLAIISTNVSGIPEVVENGENGVLIDYDISELQNVFNNLDKYDWDNMGKVSRKMFVDYYNFPRMRQDYIRMLNKALGWQ